MLDELTIRNFRVIAEASLSFGSGMHMVVGDNGAGKTSLLESIYLLFRGRSFRTNTLRSLAGNGLEGFSVDAVVSTRSRSDRMRSRWGNGVHEFLINQEPTTRSQVMGALPVLFVGPDIGLLVSGGPAIRRQFLDWLVFHVKHQHLVDLVGFNRVLRQRNVALKTHQPDGVLDAFDAQLTQLAGEVTASRSAVLDQMTWTDSSFMELAGDPSLRPGWSNEFPYEKVLRERRNKDRKLGFTASGPHRADILFPRGQAIDCDPSRGQAKLIALAWVENVVRHLKTHVGTDPLLLIDDLRAELAPARYVDVINALNVAALQTIVTAHEDLVDSQYEQPIRTFHVKHGTVTNM